MLKVIKDIFYPQNHSANPVLSSSNEISIDEQIYKDVYSAHDLLLAEANKILSQPIGYDKDRYERLRELYSLGFSNAAEVKEFMEIEKKRVEHKIVKKHIEDYEQVYPFHKFIDMKTVEIICNKYGLLLTRAGDYIAEIPEKNQNEIINFKVRRKDIRFPGEIYKFGGRLLFPNCFDSLFPKTEDEQKEYDNQKTKGSDLLIIAPEHKLDMRGKERNGHILKIKDPIVLQPVNLGYLIVSSWGLEAGDELIVNSINN